MSNQNSPLRTINKCVACQPFKQEQLAAQEVDSNRLPGGAKKIVVMRLEVLLSSEEPSIPKGSFVYVEYQNSNVVWLRKKFVFEKGVGVEGEFILVPQNEIICVEYPKQTPATLSFVGANTTCK
jgi:hypothetical protein